MKPTDDQSVALKAAPVLCSLELVLLLLSGCLKPRESKGNKNLFITTRTMTCLSKLFSFMLLLNSPCFYESRGDHMPYLVQICIFNKVMIVFSVEVSFIHTNKNLWGTTRY